MTIEDRSGWWAVEESENWICPECAEESLVDDWVEREPYCEDCGSHDGRECPRCHAVFDHVWGAQRIQDMRVKGTP